MTDDAAFSALERELSLLLRRARAVSGELAAQVHPDLDGSAYVLLASISRAGSLRASDAAALYGVDKGSISRQVARLEQMGLLERRADPSDARAQVLSLTPQGRERVERAQRSRRRHLRSRLAGWPGQDIGELAELLARYNAAVE